MITGAYLLLVIGGILYLCGWVMLLVLGFKKGIGWGLVMLFLSWLVIPLIVFLVKFWDEAKTGFLIMVAGAVLSGLGGFILVGSVATSAIAEVESFDMTRPEPAETVPDEPYESIAQPTVPMATEEEAAPDLEPAAEPEPELMDDPVDDLESEEPPPLEGTVFGDRVEWQPLPNLATLGAYEGELIELRMKDGTHLRVTLEAIEGNILRVNQRMGGGSLAYPVKMELVDDIYVMK
jgi:hypothetical protein